MSVDEGPPDLSARDRGSGAAPTSRSSKATYHALLPDASAANAYLESRARVRERREEAERLTDSLQFLRVNDVCNLLRISKPTLWRLRRANSFPEPTEVTDRVIAWRRSEVEAWLRTRDGAGGRATSIRTLAVRVPEPTIHTGPMSTVESTPTAVRASRKRPDHVPGTQSPDEQLTLPLLIR
jgi:prophage regulatory protein